MNERVAQIQAEELKASFAHLRDICGEDDAELLSDMIEGETSLDAFVGKLIEMIDDDETDSEALKASIKKKQDRKKRIDNRTGRLRTLLASVIYALPEKKFRHPLATVSAMDVDPKPIIQDESLIPSKWWKQSDPVVDQTAIRKHLLARYKALDELKECRTDEEKTVRRAEIDAEFPEIPGATLDNGDISVTIRAS